jgi:hypothetical protein
MGLPLQLRRYDGLGGDISRADILFQGQVDKAVKMGEYKVIRINPGEAGLLPACLLSTERCSNYRQAQSPALRSAYRQFHSPLVLQVAEQESALSDKNDISNHNLHRTR